MEDHWAKLLNSGSSTAKVKKGPLAGRIKATTTGKFNNKRRTDEELLTDDTSVIFNPMDVLVNVPAPEYENGIPMMSLKDAQNVATMMQKLKENRGRDSSHADVPHLDAQAVCGDEVGDQESHVMAKIDLESIERHISQLQYKVAKNVKRVPWIETLAVVVNRSLDEEKSEVSEDLRRETSFHDLTKVGLTEALTRLNAIGLPFTRPTDFFADMLKSDHQMLKVRTKLADEKARIEAVEFRKKQRLEKKFAKSVQAKRVKEKQQNKNKNLAKVEEWKKSKYKTVL